MGYKPFEFWDLMPSEIFVLIDGYRKRKIRETNRNLSLAWHTACLMRVKAEDFPKLDKLLLKEDEEKQEQTPDMMMNTVKRLNAIFGGEVVES